jgi:GGDEF domain-containing protein
MLAWFGEFPDELAAVPERLGMRLQVFRDPGQASEAPAEAAAVVVEVGGGADRSWLAHLGRSARAPLVALVTTSQAASAAIDAGVDGLCVVPAEDWVVAAVIELAIERSSRAGLDRATGLPTWASVRTQVARDLALVRRFERSSALLVVKLEGAVQADRMRQLADGLGRSVRDTDLIARYDAGELVVLMAEAEHEQARTLAQRILDDAGPGVSVGLACSTAVDVASPDDLLRQAMAACERAVLAGGSRFETCVDR